MAKKKVENWKSNIETSRKQKDQFFGSGHPQSPIRSSDLSKFKGLHYFPPRYEFRFELKLKENKNKTILNIQDSKNQDRSLIRWGEFQFKVDGKDCNLHAYKSNQEEQRLFIPFRDKTSGKETYGAGRYLDLESDKDQTSDGKWIVDFNVAYNPWCAYSNNYACPFVPPENWLDVAIEVGEKNNH